LTRVNHPPAGDFLVFFIEQNILWSTFLFGPHFVEMIEILSNKIGGTALFYAAADGWDLSTKYIMPAVITLIALVQCINLSIALCIIRTLDKYYMPLY